MREPQPPGGEQVLGSLVAEDLQRARHPRAGRDRGTRGTTKVRVVEVRESIRRRADLATHPPFLPGEDAVVRAEPGEQRADRIAVTDDDAIDPAYLAGLRRDAEPTCRADEG